MQMPNNPPQRQQPLVKSGAWSSFSWVTVLLVIVTAILWGYYFSQAQ